MLVYRVGKARHSHDLTGEGARLYGGRWNHVLTPCVYTSQSRALAVLEFSVNVNIEDIPASLSITTIEIPDKAIKQFGPEELPEGWNSIPSPAAARDFGTAWLTEAAAPVLQFPSSVIPQEYNFILNPLHPGSKHFKIIAVEELVYDVRIKNGL